MSNNIVASDVNEAPLVSLKGTTPPSLLEDEGHFDESSSTGQDDYDDDDDDEPSPPPSKRRKTIDGASPQRLLDNLNPDEKRRFTAANERRKDNDRAIMTAHAKLLAAKQELSKAQEKVNETKKDYDAAFAKAQENAEEDSEALLLEPSPWNTYYLQLKAFYERNGHCNFKRSVTDADVENMSDEKANEIKTLSWWTWRQRKYKRRGELEQHKILLLNKFGFVWEPHAGPGPGKWLKNYSLLKAFKEKNGHLKVPSKGEYGKLGSWTKTQITQYRNAKEGKFPALSEDRIKLLDEIGMLWGEKRKTTPWDMRYEALIEYRKRFGHVNVPWQWKENVALAQWVNSQRKKYKDLMDGKRNNLTDEQINRLNLIGFKWNSGGKGRYTTDSPESTLEDNDPLPTVPEILAVPMFTSAGMTGEMIEAARAAAEGKAGDTNTTVNNPSTSPNVLAGLVPAGFVPGVQVPTFMHLMGTQGMSQQAQAINYAHAAQQYAVQQNFLRYQQLAAQQNQATKGKTYASMPQSPPSL